ncbi:MAG: xanthine dehydrogenase family protein molybdopterin-binding subunit [Candidatus Cloacimonetes bacterium]|nr:xanthine dehydrogenase family protein molybdopterin-binding subunit [Candidatus Cloacimonadota bacterium]
MKPATAFRNDALAKVTGRAKYTDDLELPGQLHATVVHSPHARAEIISIDVSLALQAPGIVAVFTAKDVPGKIRFGQIIQDYPVLTDKQINSTGDVIALIVGSTREAALAARNLVKLEVKELHPLLDPEEAIREGAPLVHDWHGSNICNTHHIRSGDPDLGERESTHILEAEFITQRIEHAYLEPEAALCNLRPDGVMEVYGSMQHPFSTRRFVANTLGLPLADVEVKTIPMGGGFGGKDDTAALVCARAALCAYLLNRPVKLIYSREMSFRESYKRHPYKITYRLGLDDDGLIRFVKVRILADGGAYCSVTPWVTWRSTVQCCGCYQVPHVHCDTYGVYTNNVFSGAMRGFGSPQVNFAIEQLIEMAGEKLGLDEISIRRKNMLHQGSTTITGQVLDTHIVSLKQVMDRVLDQINYSEKRKQCSFGKGEGELYGIGFAISYRGMSLGAEGVDLNSAILNVQPDGSVLLETGIHENGQGSESAMILIAAEELGLPRESIRYRLPSTSNIPDGGTTVASRGTIMGGGAVVNAAGILKKLITEALLKHHPQYSVLPSDTTLVFADKLISTADRSIQVSWLEAIRLCFANQIYPYAFGVFQAPNVSWDEETGQGNAYFTWVYGCQAVELKVEPRSGKITLTNLVAAHDVGKAINPELVKGQFYGGMAMASGYALLEDCRVDKGMVVPSNFHNYHLARATDLPEMTAIIIENPDPNSPSKAKGIGEPTNELMAPAIANALYHATGKRCFKLPLKA